MFSMHWDVIAILTVVVIPLGLVLFFVLRWHALRKLPEELIKKPITETFNKAQIFVIVFSALLLLGLLAVLEYTQWFDPMLVGSIICAGGAFYGYRYLTRKNRGDDEFDI